MAKLPIQNKGKVPMAAPRFPARTSFVAPAPSTLEPEVAEDEVHEAHEDELEVFDYDIPPARQSRVGKGVTDPVLKRLMQEEPGSKRCVIFGPSTEETLKRWATVYATTRRAVDDHGRDFRVSMRSNVLHPTKPGVRVVAVWRAPIEE